VIVETGGKDLFIVKEFRAPVQELYKSWSEPSELAAWMGPAGVAVPVVDVDLRIGGAYRICIRFPNGVEYCWGGQYLALVPPTHLSFTVDYHGEDGRYDRSDPTRISVDLEPSQGGTRMTFRQSPFPPRVDRAAHADGWVEAFGKLQQMLEPVGQS